MVNPRSKLTRVRLELEKYDITVEYLKGKGNFVADALSRITLTEFKNVHIKVLKVTTRQPSKQKSSSAGEKQEDLSIQTLDASKSNVYEVRMVVVLLLT